MPILLKLQAGQSPLGQRMALFAYENKTRAVGQVNLSTTRRLDAEAQVTLAKHQHALTDREQFAKRQEYDSLVVKQKLTQDLENEHLRQELEELKRSSSAYLRAQHQFTQTFAQTSGQFMNRVVMPAMETVSKPFSAKSADDGKAPEQVHSTNKSAKVFEFGSIHGLGAKAAS
jgi:type II secretory pathway component HofQ